MRPQEQFDGEKPTSEGDLTLPEDRERLHAELFSAACTPELLAFRQRSDIKSQA